VGFYAEGNREILEIIFATLHTFFVLEKEPRCGMYEGRSRNFE